MGFCNISLALLFILGSALIQSSHAQDTLQDYLNSHNAAREAVDVGPLTWDDNVAGYAQNYANQHVGDCYLVHSSGPYGENLAMSTGDLSGTAAVDMWVAAQSNADPTSTKHSLTAIQMVINNGMTLGYNLRNINHT